MFAKFFLVIMGFLHCANSFGATYDFSYSGRLVDSTGRPLDGPVALKASFFHSETGTTSILDVTTGLTQVPLSEGVFQIKLSLSDSDFQRVFPNVNQNVYIQITDLTHSANQPYDRQQLTILPYAGKIPIDTSQFSWDSLGQLHFTASTTADFSSAGPIGSTTPNTAIFTTVTTNKTSSATSGSVVNVTISPTYNQASGTATNTDLLINRTETAVGSGTQRLIDAQVGGTTRFNVSNTGNGYFAGNVGIGTTSPLSNAHIAGSNNAANAGANNYGNLFVGTTDSFASDKGGSIALGGKFGSTATWNGISTFAKVSGRKEGAGDNFLDGYLAFETSNNTTSPYSVERMRISSTGNVGIGTTSPTDKIDINGTAAIRGKTKIFGGGSNSGELSFGTSENHLFGATTGGAGTVGFYWHDRNADSATTVGGSYNALYLATPGAKIFQWLASSVEKAYIDVTGGAYFAGNVGIGTTAPYSPFHVSKTTSGYSPTTIGNAGLLQLSSGDTSGNMAGIRFGGASTEKWFGEVHTSANTSDLVFQGYDRAAAAKEYLRITEGGNVGIGTTSPTEILTVAGNIVLTPNTANGTAYIGAGDSIHGALSNRKLSMDDGTYVTPVTTGTGGPSQGWGFVAGAGNFEFKAGSTSRFIVQNGGNVGIGNTNPSQKLAVGANGDGSVAIANSWTTYSDKRLKKNISVIDSALEKISALSGYFFHWKKGSDKSRQIGVMAQEVEKIFPELVKQGADGIKSVDYPKLAVPMLEAIKSLKGQVDQLKDDNAKFESENAIFKSENALFKSETAALKSENEMMKTYLCDKDPSASFCARAH